MIIKILIAILMLAILFSLFRGLYFLATEKSDSKKVVKSLGWRIGLSMTLFLLIVAAILLGWIEPHGLPTVTPKP
ncbi:MAG: twin transmembrane helix small protein [Enterobacterales bacterium]|nr:twin transmembrane helix small protein [Enterobacterales bacterium]